MLYGGSQVPATMLSEFTNRSREGYIVSRSTKDGARGRRRTRAAITGDGEPRRVGGEYPVRDPAGAEMADGKHRAHHRAAEDRGGGDGRGTAGGHGAEGGARSLSTT